MRYAACAFGTILSLSAVPGIAEEGTNLSTIVVTRDVGEGSGDENEYSAPGTDNTTLGQAELELSNPTDLGDVFQNEPRISVGGSNSISQKIYVNGVEETNLLVTIDGGRQNNKIFHHNTTNLIDPALLKQVSVDAGVAPADIGPGALAGAIQFETRDPKDILEPGKTIGGFVAGEYITNGDIFSTSVSGYGHADGVEWLGYLKFADGGLRKDGGGNTIIGSKTHLLSGLAKLAYQAATGDRIEVSFERVRDDESRPYRANIGQIIGGRPVPLERPYDLLRQNIVATYTDETPTGMWDPTIRIAYSFTDLGAFDTDEVAYGWSSSLNGKFENRFPLENGSVTAGLDFYADKGRLNYDYFPLPAFSETAVEKAENVGLYAQTRLTLMEVLRLSFGGRADLQQFHGVNGHDDTNAGASGNISAEWDINSIFTANAGFSHVWAGIQLAEPFLMNFRWDYPRTIKPTRANNVVAGLKATIQNFILTGKFFYTNLDTIRDETYNPPATGAIVMREAESIGFEVGGRANWDGGYFNIAYGYVDTKIDGVSADTDIGQYITSPIGQIITAQIVHKFDNTGVTVGADAEFALKQKSYDPYAMAPGVPFPAYEVVNAFVEFVPPPLPNVTLRVEANNIFDENYSSRATYGEEYGNVRPLREPGRSFVFTAKVKI
ncbi:MAG: TonB-dependent receptor [Pseudomonadota bacterium]